MEVFGYIVKIDTSWYLKSFVADTVNVYAAYGISSSRTVVDEFSVTFKSRESHVFPSKDQATEVADQLGGTVFRLYGELAEEAR
ncbi:MAG: hypothetical protein ACRCWQ_13755 [Bacilli bacterium]